MNTNTNSSKEVFPLLLAKENESVTVTALKGGQQFKQKCIDMGIIPGANIEILINSGSGPCAVLLNNSRMVIGQGMLQRIFVKR